MEPTSKRVVASALMNAIRTGTAPSRWTVAAATRRHRWPASRASSSASSRSPVDGGTARPAPTHQLCRKPRRLNDQVSEWRNDPLACPWDGGFRADVMPLGGPGPDVRSGQVDLIMIGDSQHAIENVRQLIRDAIAASLVPGLAIPVREVVALGRQDGLSQVPDLLGEFHHHDLQAPRPALA